MQIYIEMHCSLINIKIQLINTNLKSIIPNLILQFLTEKCILEIKYLTVIRVKS